MQIIAPYLLNNQRGPKECEHAFRVVNGMCVFFEMPLIFDHFHYCKNQIQFVYREYTVAKTPIMPMQSMESQRNTQTNCL